MNRTLGPGNSESTATGARVRPPRRVVLVLQSADPPTSIGGMETVCVDLAAELGRRGVQVMAIIPETDVFGSLAQRFQLAGARVKRLTTDGRNGRWPQVRRWQSLAGFLRRWRPDVVHLHTGGATGGLAVVAIARLASAAKVVITEHDVPDQMPSVHQRQARRVLDRFCHAVIAVSRRNAALRQERLPVENAKLLAVLNGVPMPEFALHEKAAHRAHVRAELDLSDEIVVIGSLVRLAAGKGLDDLIRAFARVSEAQNRALLLVGDGPLREELEALAAELGVAHRVRFAGHQARPAAYLDAMDVFALCVPAGSQSIALLEAMARGLPPVITFWGPEEPVIREVTGLAAPPRDPAGLAEVLNRLVVDANLRTQLGAAAERHVRRNFSVSRVADDLIDIYLAASPLDFPGRLLASKSGVLCSH